MAVKSAWRKEKALPLSLAKTLTGLGDCQRSHELARHWAADQHYHPYWPGRALQGVSGAYLTRIARQKRLWSIFVRTRPGGDRWHGEVVAVAISAQPARCPDQSIYHRGSDPGHSRVGGRNSKKNPKILELPGSAP